MNTQFQGTKLMTRTTQFLSQMLVAVFCLMLLAFGTVTGGTTKAQADQCNKFNPVPTPLSSQWIPCPDAPNVTLSTSNFSSIGGVNDFYLKANDTSGSSVICSAPSNPILGDWSKAGRCTEFCFDAQAFDNYDGTLRSMSIEINSGMSKRFVFAFSLAADKIAVDGKWHRFCVPIKPVAGGAPLPSTAQGIWVPRTGTVESDWNSMLTNVTEIRLPIDMTASPSEVMAYDNLCLNGVSCADEASIKKFTKSATRVCDFVTYTLHVEIESQGAVPQNVTISDLWPSGLFPANAVVLSGNPSVTAVTSLTPTGWGVSFTTATGSGPVTGIYDITFTSQIDPVAIAKGDITLTNQATIVLGKDGSPVKSDDPAKSGISDPTVIFVPAAEIVKCKEPPVVSCLSGDAKVTCGEKPGTYVITLATTGAGGTIPTLVSISSTTVGVTIVNPQVSYPVVGGQVKTVVAGAKPGDVLDFEMQGTTAGEGSAAGTDLCCNGTIQVTIPKDLQCKQPDISILKTGPKTCLPGQPCTFTITVTNNGGP